MAANPRIEELRKRLEKEPASRLFAQLAEELRKEGDLEEAIAVCREGLQKHPNYPSARMTLGRALFDTGDFAAARSEFDVVVKAAPDNILASRYLAECHEKLGDLERAEAQYRHTLRLSPDDKQVTARLDAVVQRRGGAPVATATAAAPPARPSAASMPGLRPSAPSAVVAPPAPSPARSGPASGVASSPAPPRAVPPAPPPPRPAAIAPAPPVVAPAPPAPPPPAPIEPVEPPPIPLVEADEEFELERSYEAPPPPAVVMKSTAEQAMEREFELEQAREAAARWGTVAPADEGDAVEAVTENTLPGAAAPDLSSVEGSTGNTARFTALDEEAIEQAARARTASAGVGNESLPGIVVDPSLFEVEPEGAPEPVPVPVPAPRPQGVGSDSRPGLETLFRFSAFDVEEAMASEAAKAAAPAPIPAPTPAPAPAPVPPTPPAPARPTLVPPPSPPVSSAPAPSPVAVPAPPPPPRPAPVAPVVPAPPPPAPTPPPVPSSVAAPIMDAGEIVSPTIAELYFGQGHIDKAIDVYRRLLRGGPENEKARRRLLELEALDRRMREEAAPGTAAATGLSREERRAAIERTIARLEALLTVLRKE